MKPQQSKFGEFSIVIKNVEQHHVHVQYAPYITLLTYLAADENNDKKLSCEEVKNYLKYGDILSCNDGGEQNWFKSMDQNNDGLLEGNEIDEDYQKPKSTNYTSFHSYFLFQEKRVNRFN